MKSNIVNVLDLELLCWENNIIPPGQVREIIDVGICMADITTGTIVKTVSMPVIPSSPPSEYCTNLTGWTMAKLLRQGTTLAEVTGRIKSKYGGKNRVLVVDSADEAPTFRAQCERLNIDFPFGDEQVNVNILYQLVTGTTENIGLDRMLATFGMQFEGKRHKAADDAYNIARLFLKLLQIIRSGFNH